MQRRFLLYVLGLSLIVILGGIAQGYPLKASLNSMQVVPPNNSNAHGLCRISGSNNYEFGMGFDVNCDFQGLSGPLIDADIRLGRAGQNGEAWCTDKRVWTTLPNTGSGVVTISCQSDGWVPAFTTKEFYAVLQTSNFPDGEVRGQIKPAALDLDVDGEGRAEVSIFRPADRSFWSYCTMAGGPISKPLVDWEPLTDSTPFLADLDGDAIADWTFIRTNAETGVMSVLFRGSSSDQLRGVQLGNTNYGDIYTFGDYDGDGRIGVAVFRPSADVVPAASRWYIIDNLENYNLRYEYWGTFGDTPCAGDFDGDGRTDLCVARPENDQFTWYIRRSSDNQTVVTQWGLSTDTLYPRNAVDVDGDGLNDLLVSRLESKQVVFYALRSSDGNMFALPWGLSTDAIKIGDYDADGRTDFAAIREIEGQLLWFINESTNGPRTFQWGLPGDK